MSCSLTKGITQNIYRLCVCLNKQFIVCLCPNKQFIFYSSLFSRMTIAAPERSNVSVFVVDLIKMQFMTRIQLEWRTGSLANVLSLHKLNSFHYFYMLSAHHVFFCFLSTVTLLTWACPVWGVWMLAPWAPVHITDTSLEHALYGEFEHLPHGRQFISLTHHLSMPCMGSLNTCPMGASSYHWHIIWACPVWGV